MMSIASRLALSGEIALFNPVDEAVKQHLHYVPVQPLLSTKFCQQRNDWHIKNKL